MQREKPRQKNLPHKRNTTSKENKTRIAEKQGSIVKHMSGKIIGAHHTTTVKEAAALMIKNDVRRLPITNAGTQRLEGIVAAVDILDFLGGGIKYEIIRQDYGENFLKAVNCPIHKIMEEIQYLPQTAGKNEAVQIMVDKKTSCIPIVEDGENLKVIGLVTERDVLPEKESIGKTVEEAMVSDLISSSKGMMIGDAAKIMVRNRVRRLPVMEEEDLKGIVTALDILSYLAKGQYKGVNARENLSTRVQEVMEHEVKTLNPQDDLGKVVELVKETGLGGFPVTRENRIQGIVTVTDVLKHAR